MEHSNPQQGEQDTPDHLAGHRPGQEFTFGPWSFDIDQAVAFLKEQPRETHALAVRPWARACGLDNLDHPTAISLIGPGPDFNREYALTTDLQVPLIVATLHHPELGEHFLLIDGAHRLYRAFVEGLADLPAYLLNTEESLQIRMERGLR